MRYAVFLALVCVFADFAVAQELSADRVLKSIAAGRSYLKSRQQADGRWPSRYGAIGPTSLAVMALTESDESPDSPVVRAALDSLDQRPLDSIAAARETYETSLLLLALAEDADRHRAKIAALAARLERGQIKRGSDAGMWGYQLAARSSTTAADHSNTQFAVLALYAAAMSGITPDVETWSLIRQHWLSAQNPDGGWGYARLIRTESYGSMTVAGLAALQMASVIIDRGINRDGSIDCCGVSSDEELQAALRRGEHWLATRFAISRNPGPQRGARTSLFYYLYGLERAGRLGVRRFIGEHDWYREGADWLVRQQSPADGRWQGIDHGEEDPVISTSFALLFLSKGMAPVVMNRLQLAAKPTEAEHHRHDVPQLVSFTSQRPQWPRLLASQNVDLEVLADPRSVETLLQAPVLFAAGDDSVLRLAGKNANELRHYLDLGGFLFVSAGCESDRDSEAMKRLVEQIYPNGEARLARLPPDHPILRAEFLLDPESIELWGVDVGCRTAIVFSPVDLSCYWGQWRPYPQAGLAAETAGQIEQRLRIGVNVLAYATGREPPTKLDVPKDPFEDGKLVERGSLELAWLKAGDVRSPAPRALARVAQALREKGELPTSVRKEPLNAMDESLYKYPVLNMHGRASFSLAEREIERLRTHLNRGGVLFADACCGSTAFDASFRTLAASLYPDRTLKRIPPEHELYSAAIAYDLSHVKRRISLSQAGPIQRETVDGPPFLEGIEIDGRYAVIYSRYDLSCALQSQSSAACDGYHPADAAKIATNIVLHAMLQEVSSFYSVEPTSKSQKFPRRQN